MNIPISSKLVYMSLTLIYTVDLLRDKNTIRRINRFIIAPERTHVPVPVPVHPPSPRVPAIPASHLHGNWQGSHVALLHLDLGETSSHTLRGSVALQLSNSRPRIVASSSLQSQSRATNAHTRRGGTHGPPWIRSTTAFAYSGMAGPS